MTATEPAVGRDIWDILEEHMNAYQVYCCEECGKPKPNPYVIFSEGFGCECGGIQIDKRPNVFMGLQTK